MGQVIDIWTAREMRVPSSQAVFHCLRCGADVWTILTDGSVRCADCEQECTLRVTAGGGNDWPLQRGD